MKAIIINKDGIGYEFNSVKEARRNILYAENSKMWEIEAVENGRKVKIFDVREYPVLEDLVKHYEKVFIDDSMLSPEYSITPGWYKQGVLEKNGEVICWVRATDGYYGREMYGKKYLVSF